MYHTIRPGQIWLDTDGNRIQAHGGSILTVGDTFYWYGENKEKTTGEDALWHWGVRCYSSKDLYNWKSEGIIIPSETGDETSPLHPNAMMDRPHIVYNEKTGKYVAWLKIMGEPPCFAVLTADHILGPYQMENPRVNPCGLTVGDFDLAVDADTGKGYLISEKPHTMVYIAELNEEYTDAAGSYSEHFPHTAPPEAREAPAHFMRNGLHYLITSGTTGYFPNPSEVSCARDWHGPYEMQGNPHVGDRSKTSFNFQITSVFRHPKKKDLYIALADRWRPELPALAGETWESGAFSEEIQAKFRRIFDPSEEFVFTPEDAKDMRIHSAMSDYVWLPLKFDGNQVKIEWTDEWRIEDYTEV
ncbi:MAG: family 43 glycosylhydrolase [Eubacteriales bacterium]|nr:family 43 glycosylhydrolase [Eubacteriales bacterium]